MDQNPFRSTTAKLDRAKHLTAEIGSIVSSYDGAKLVASDRNGGIGWNLRVTKPVPEMAPIVGDAIHNLRAALDHLAVAAVGLNGRSSRGVYFPFAERAEDLDEMIERRKFHRASPEALNLLRELRPYRGGNEALRGIHDLDVADKHHSLVPVWTGAAQQVPLHVPGGVMHGIRFPILDGFGLAHHAGSGAAALAPMPVALYLAFHPDNPFGRQEIVPTLESLSQLVRGIIEAFVALYQG